jgi:hypothetical protein
MGSRSLSPTTWALNRSGSAEADGHFAGIYDHGDIARIIGEREHALESLGVAQDINIVERDVAFRVSRTGIARIRSEILAEDENCVHDTRI